DPDLTFARSAAYSGRPETNVPEIDPSFRSAAHPTHHSRPEIRSADDMPTEGETGSSASQSQGRLCWLQGTNSLLLLPEPVCLSVCLSPALERWPPASQKLRLPH